MQLLWFSLRGGGDAKTLRRLVPKNHLVKLSQHLIHFNVHCHHLKLTILTLQFSRNTALHLRNNCLLYTFILTSCIWIVKSIVCKCHMQVFHKMSTKIISCLILSILVSMCLFYIHSNGGVPQFEGLLSFLNAMKGGNAFYCEELIERGSEDLREPRATQGSSHLQDFHTATRLGL